ncbi:MAG: hypothetical protein KKB81_04410 [Candidatus Margulisbacteria bacterium]|nr:hypothetical protein [Candidatus Margulisiibacteriota bacterium]MBU1021989.1 hypothetical protein [Candidatus Margulisiibacteriota bacterium]MBU1728967.1 hypothetical protein [Candidatus Margulisiibacteriota bacterium]MBU1954773.1 hypothetical protein [Candidatus Margulisiibacteriota bacterium]
MKKLVVLMLVVFCLSLVATTVSALPGKKGIPMADYHSKYNSNHSKTCTAIAANDKTVSQLVERVSQ